MMIGIVGGIVVAIVANRINRPATKTRGIVTNTLGITFGALGAQAADQLLYEGPQLFGSQIVPAIVGEAGMWVSMYWCMKLF